MPRFTRFVPFCAVSMLSMLLAGCGEGGTEAPDPAVAVDPDAPPASPDGPPEGVGVRGAPATLEEEQTGAYLD